MQHPSESSNHQMSGLSSFLPAKLLGSMNNNRDRPSDPLHHLRFALETMPGSRKYVFTPATRTEIISELYDAFWGAHAELFVPNAAVSLPLHSTLHELQRRMGFGMLWREKVELGRPCGNIFKKGECCFRCRQVCLVFTLYSI
jgi:E3 ubiquitin-protein ligase UBR1